VKLPNNKRSSAFFTVVFGTFHHTTADNDNTMTITLLRVRAFVVDRRTGKPLDGRAVKANAEDKKRRTIPLGLLRPVLGLVIAISAGMPTDGMAQARGRQHPDFNGDGYDDLVVGIPGYDLRDARGQITVDNVGAVNVFYGSPSGADTTAVHLLNQNSSLLGVAIAGAAGPDDAFGTAIEWGDFNGDGFSDLVVGVPGETVGTQRGAGAINVIYGSAVGLTGLRNKVWHQNTTGVLGVAEADDRFGAALAAGDFNRDGFDDLAIGVPGENSRGGAVNVLYGTAVELTAAGANVAGGNQVWDRTLLNGVWRANDSFGWALAAGDFDFDGDDDLAVGVPFSSIEAGSVNIINGSRAGLTSQGNLFIDRDTPGIAGQVRLAARFGYALIAGDFKGRGGRHDLAVGVPGDGPGVAAGSVQVIYGSGSGLAGSSNSIFHQDSAFVPGKREDCDGFGRTLAVGDFNGDGFDDLAVGAPGEWYQKLVQGGALWVYVRSMGTVNVLYGGSSGFRLIYSQAWDPDDFGDQREVDGLYGSYLMTGDLNHDGYHELAIGHPGDDPSPAIDAGSVDVLHGSPNNLTAQGRQFLVEMAGDLWRGNVVSHPQSSSFFGGPWRLVCSSP
jgi:hypothetical protein